MVVQDLFLTVTYVTWMHVTLSRLSGRAGRRAHGIAVGVGAAAAAALAAVKYNTRLVVSSHLMHYLYGVIVAAALLFLIALLVWGRKEEGVSRAGRAALGVTGGLMSALLIFYALPGVLLYPFTFNTMGQGFFSAYYMERLAGWALALVLLLVYARMTAHCAGRVVPYAVLPCMLGTGILGYFVYCFGYYFVPWVNRAKWLGWPVRFDAARFGWIRSWMMFSATSGMLFIWIGAAMAAAMAVCVLLRHVRVTDPYENPAQLRKLRARNRRYRRTACAALVCLALSVLILTAVKGYDTRVVELSAPETYSIEGDRILVPMDLVSDGHLHRFEYRTARNVDVRWIVVKKPGSASFGVGLDACEVCGSAGYFERNGQVICKRCDVVMNINTIGFKGGCNPIPLAYEVADGRLVFRIGDLEAAEKEFR